MKPISWPQFDERAHARAPCAERAVIKIESRPCPLRFTITARISSRAHGSMYTAVIRRQPGGFGLKVPKRTGSLFLTDTCASNVATFVSMRWPRHLTSFLCFGRSQHTEKAARSALLTAPRRRSSQLALRSDDPESSSDADSLRLYGGGGAPKTLLGEQQSLTPSGEPVDAAAARAAAAAAAPAPKFSLHQLRLKHAREQPISMVTAYDYPSARIADAAGVDVLLVGDSVGMVVLGREDTTEVTMDEMVHHCRAAATGTSRSLLVGDLPFGSCLTPLDAARNGVRLVKEGRADAVKLEGGEHMVPQVRVASPPLDRFHSAVSSARALPCARVPQHAPCRACACLLRPRHAP